MRNEFHFYMDDSGSRDPDKNRNADPNSPPWFGLGGLIVHSSEVALAKDSLSDFRSRWPELKDHPLRSYNIRNMTGSFRWLADASMTRRREFFDDLTSTMLSLPVHGMACVVDRPGYNERYREIYGQRRWKLCKTAFNIAVERAAKYARFHGARLRVFIERSDRATETQMRSYYDDMRAHGLPFDQSKSAIYAPLCADGLRETLYEFDVKTKNSVLMQAADLMLLPLCKGGYNADERIFAALKAAGKLLDCRCNAENGLLGIKYSCFRS